MILALTKHFRLNYRERVGCDPDPREINELIKECMLVCPARRFELAGGGSFLTLAIFWHPGKDLVIKVDPENCTCVSVLSRANWRGGPRRAVDGRR